MSKINYPLDLIRAVVMDVDGCLSPATVPVGDDGTPQRMTNLRDGYAIVQAIRKGLRICILTGAISQSVENRYKKLGVQDVIMISGPKLPVLKEWMERNALDAPQVAYLGDDIPDLQCLKYVGLPCAPHDAVPEVLESAMYISQKPGGYGVAREIIEEILRAQNNWDVNTEAYGK